MFEEQSVKEVCQFYKADEKRGLSVEEAQKRMQQNGKNELQQERQKSIVESFLEQLNDPLICVLLVAVMVSFLLKEMSDAMIILVVILVNASVGVIQEGKARRALDALKRLTSPHAMVRRSGKIYEIAASELVVGDIVILETGGQVPADIRLTQAHNLKIEESALTGESLSVEKDVKFQAQKSLQVGERKNEAFMTTMVTAGRGEGIVIATGMNTEIGKIASIIQGTPREYTPLQKRLAELGKLLSIVSVLLCLVLFLIAVFQKRNVFDMLITAISLAVAAVPEGLPAIVTIVLAMSVSKMVKVNTIIRKLPSVETLGAVNVVCSDKTGTLTQNKMTVTTCYVNEKQIPISVQNIRQQAEIPVNFLEGFTLCNDAVIQKEGKGRKENVFGDPTELALLQMAFQCGIRKVQVEYEHPRISERAFDSSRKMMTTVHKKSAHSGGVVAYTKGAPDVVLNRCTNIWINGAVQPLTEGRKRRILEAMEEMSHQALRVLALAMQVTSDGNTKKLLEERNLTFVGLAGMKDPIRPEAKVAVDQFKNASVQTVMITGDHADTALAIARELGIAKSSRECMTGAELEQISDKELGNRLPELHVFARVSPEHKVRIVKQLKQCGNIVAMTGDGVNDAPSLQMADIGIAMGMTGTDVAKQASDMILTDDNFATIEQAIEEGRSIYENIRKTVLFLLSSNFGEIITMFVAVVLGMASPLKASHILWINLITDSLPALALGVDKNDKKALMKRPPRKASEGLFANGGLACTCFYGVLIAAISLTAFLKLPWEILRNGQQAFSLENIKFVLQDGPVLARSQTYAFTVLGMAQLFHAFGMQDVRTSVFAGWISGKRQWNWMMAAAFVVGIFLQGIVTEVPVLVQMFGTASLTLEEWSALLVLAAFPVLAHEVFAVLFRVRWEKS